MSGWILTGRVSPRRFVFMGLLCITATQVQELFLQFEK
jgi:hypothetical protein